MTLQLALTSAANLETVPENISLLQSRRCFHTFIMAASLKVGKQFRSWNNEDSFEKSDVVRLFDPEKVKYTKSPGCERYWMVYLSLFCFIALFIIGILLGFFVRADQKVDDKCENKFARADGFDQGKLQSVHNSIMYYISSENIAKSAR